MFRLILLCFMFVVPASAHSIPNEVAEQVSARANLLASATLAEDYDQVIALSYPPLVNKIGGPSMAAKIAYEAVRLLNEEGVIISDLTIGDPLAYYATDQQQLVVLATQLELKSEQGRVNTQSYLLAIREPNTPWLFIDSNALKDLAELKGYFPGLPNDFSLPEKAVTFTPAKQ
jgi:hypothetical protein